MADKSGTHPFGGVIVELKAAQDVNQAHEAQLINDLKATGLEVGQLRDQSGVSPQDFRIGPALARRLGNFPFWRGDEPFLDATERIYRSASSTAVELLSGLRTESTMQERWN
jgi:hypothetical protein